LEAAAAASRKNAGAGIRSRSLTRLDRAATIITAAAARMTTPNDATLAISSRGGRAAAHSLPEAEEA
jgi:hypothetical protein